MDWLHQQASRFCQESRFWLTKHLIWWHVVVGSLGVLPAPLVARPCHWCLASMINEHESQCLFMHIDAGTTVQTWKEPCLPHAKQAIQP
ncbi:hypothetical protein WJX77_010342 [Trebouxia sp. C0004]